MNAKAKKFLIGSLLVLLLGLLIFLYILSNRVAPVPEGTVGNSAGNLYNGGMFCEYNGKVYFANPYDGNALYVMDTDGSHMKKLIATSVSNICAGGKYLFYFQNTSSGTAGLGYLFSSHSLCRAQLNGRHITSLSKEVIYNMQLIDNYLYYQCAGTDGPRFYRQKISAREPELLERISADFSCALPDGTVYYAGNNTNHYLYRYDTHSGSTSAAWQGDLWYPVYDNGYIYYLDVANNYRLCRYSLSADEIEVLTNDRVDCFNLTGNYVYYQKNSVENPALIRMQKDGSNPVILMDGNYTHISVAGDYVYFATFENGYPLYRVADGYDYPEVFQAASDAAFEARK